MAILLDPFTFGGANTDSALLSEYSVTLIDGSSLPDSVFSVIINNQNIEFFIYSDDNEDAGEYQIQVKNTATIVSN